MPNLSLEELTALTVRALEKAGASSSMAKATADALIAAESEGLSGHGVSRVALYCQHVREGRADGRARPELVHEKASACLIDAGGGLAYEAVAMAEKILDVFSSPFIVRGREIYSGASIGLSIAPNDGDNLDTLLSNADAAS